MPVIVAVVGTHNSGKTTTLEYLISNLTKEGFTVGTIKHIHHEFSIDKEGTNTWRHMQAGSKITVAVAPNETTIIKKTAADENSLDKVICLLNKEELDFIFIEGFHELVSRRDDILRVVAAKDSEDLKETLGRITPPILAITGLVAKQKKQNQKDGVLLVDLPKEGPILLEHIKLHLKQA
jgi:molybdopterin-guanine dinucleotide biosynthesis protein MobB